MIKNNINVSVSYICVLTTCTSYEQTLTPVGVNGGALPCVRLAYVTCSDCVTKEPHLWHYELKAKQHVLGRTRVHRLTGDIQKATQQTILDEVAQHRFNRTTQECPEFIEMHTTRPQP